MSYYLLELPRKKDHLSEPVTLHLETTASGVWIYLQRSPGRLPETPLFQLLNWVLEQLNFGNFESEESEDGDAVTLILGKGGFLRRAFSTSKAPETRVMPAMPVDASISGVAVTANAKPATAVNNAATVMNRVMYSP